MSPVAEPISMALQMGPACSVGRAGPSWPGSTQGGVPFSNLPKGAQEILNNPARSCWANIL